MDEAAAAKRAAGVAQMLFQIGRRVLEKRNADDLHAVQWSALRYFARTGRRTANVNGLSQFLGNTTGSSSRTIKSLVERGLLEGTPSRTDARSTVIKLTQAGRRALRKDPLNDIAMVLEGMEPGDLDQLGQLLDLSLIHI